MPTTWLIERMEQWRDKPAIVWHDHLFTYRDVLEGIKSWSCELDAQGVRSGFVVGVEGD